ncbi:alpha/beta fold hydrolase [Pseudonocardia sp. C8]|uniref:alpha/beta fold hydrolase n=1 Tax=Pseudonocardia sp. C8 TaxID=2762759 RepID=UPI0016433B89|nr:alpha/beta fold hydrolase [Pseudonocardia sp. C8]MBC3190233.1 alpha/beta fold hydrolase [Pseudonocardia sp. C8]
MAAVTTLPVHPPATRPGRGAGAAAEPRLADPATLGPLPPEQPPWPGRTVTAGGVALHVRETPGDGAAEAVYVHGLAGSATNWTDLAGLLGTRAAGLSVDLPGFGLSEPTVSRDFTPDGMADALLCWLAGRGRPVHLVGNSLGGLIAMTVAARRPELVRSLALVSPAMPDLRPDPRRFSDPRIALAMVPVLGRGARRALAAEPLRSRAERIVKVCFADPRRGSERRLEELVAEHAHRATLPWAAEATDAATRGLLALWAGRAVWQRAARVRVPSLVLWGAQDRVVSPRLARRTAAALPDARLLVLPRAGHVPQIERPEDVARAVAGLWDET